MKLENASNKKLLEKTLNLKSEIEKGKNNNWNKDFINILENVLSEEKEEILNRMEE